MAAAKPNVEPVIDNGERRADANASMDEVLNNLQKGVSRHRENMAVTKDKVKQLTALTENLADGYKISVKMVLDMSGMLTKYMHFLDNLSMLFSEMEKNSILDPNDLRNVKILTMNSVGQVQERFRSSMDEIITQFKKNGMSSHVQEIEALRGNVENIAAMARTAGGAAIAGASAEYMSSYITKGGAIRFKRSASSANPKKTDKEKDRKKKGV